MPFVPPLFKNFGKVATSKYTTRHNASATLIWQENIEIFFFARYEVFGGCWCTAVFLHASSPWIISACFSLHFSFRCAFLIATALFNDKYEVNASKADAQKDDSKLKDFQHRLTVTSKAAPFTLTSKLAQSHNAGAVIGTVRFIHWDVTWDRSEIKPLVTC